MVVERVVGEILRRLKEEPGRFPEVAAKRGKRISPEQRERLIRDFRDEIARIPAKRSGEKVLSLVETKSYDESFALRWEGGLKDKTLAFLKEFGDRAAERFLEKHEHLNAFLKEFNSDDFFGKYFSLSKALGPVQAYIAFGNRYEEIQRQGIDTEHSYRTEHYYKNVLRAFQGGGKVFAKWYGYDAVGIMESGGSIDELLEESLRVHKAGGIKISNSFLYNAGRILKNGESLHNYAEESLKLIEEFGPDTARWMVRACSLKNYMGEQDYDFDSFRGDARALSEKNKKAAFWFSYGMEMLLEGIYEQKTRYSSYTHTPIDIQEYRSNFADILAKHGLSAAILYSISTKEMGGEKIASFKKLPEKMHELREKTTEEIFKSALWLASLVCKNHVNRGVGKTLELWDAIIKEYGIRKNEALILDRMRYTIKMVKMRGYSEGGKTVLGNLATDLASNYIEVRGEEPRGELEPEKDVLPVTNLPKDVAPDYIEVNASEPIEEREEPTNGLDANGDPIF